MTEIVIRTLYAVSGKAHLIHTLNWYQVNDPSISKKGSDLVTNHTEVLYLNYVNGTRSKKQAQWG